MKSLHKPVTFRSTSEHTLHMARLKSTTDQLILTHQGGGIGCAITIFILVDLTLFIGLIGVFYIYQTERAGEPLPMMWHSFVFLATGLALVIYNQRNMAYYWQLVIDKSNKKIRVRKSRSGTWFTFGFGEVDSLYINKETKHQVDSGSSSNPSRTHFQLFFMLEDGSQFWVDSSLDSKEPMLQLAQQLSEWLKIPFEEKAGDLPPDLTYTDHWGRNPPRKSALKISQEEGYELLSVPLRTNSIGNLALVCLLTFFISIVFSFLLSNDSPTAGNIFFSACFTLVIVLIVSMNLFSRKQYQLAIKDQVLQVRLSYPSFLRKADEIIDIPKEAIRGLQVNRLAEGHYWLAIAVRDFQLPMTKRLKINSGVFSKNAIHKQTRDLIGLWEVPMLQKDSQGLSLADLHFIRSWVIHRLAL